jgi:hypothetical protein
MKKNSFSLNRIGLMLRADWIEYKKSFLLFVALLLAVNMILLWKTSDGSQKFGCFVSFLFTVRYYFTFVGRKLHREKNRFLTLPSSAIEKFTEILFVGFLHTCVFVLIHTLILGLSHLISGTEIWFMQNLDFTSKFNQSEFNGAGMVTGLVVFIITFLFMCFTAIRKYPLQIGVLCLILY